MSKVNDILAEARQLAEKSKTWADLSNALFDPLEGLVVKYFLNASERKEFRKSATYDELHDLVEQKMHQTGVVEGAEPKKSGKFVVRVPRSLHAALEKEAENEGTSLNQLILTKLAVQLQNFAGDETARIIQAYVEVRNRCSTERVIADPQLDRMFLQRCREYGVKGTDFEINWKLMNERKNSRLSNIFHLIKTVPYRTGKEIDEYEYASEIAIRYMQINKNVSLDQIMCDPDLANEFDRYASSLSPGYQPIEYRWAAFGLRKAGRLNKKQLDIKELPNLEKLGIVNSVKIEDLPLCGGIYMFSSNSEKVFTSQTDNLRHRFEKHLEVSNSRGLPYWLWDIKREPLIIEVAALPNESRNVRQAIEKQIIKTFKPLLNIERKVA